MSPSPDPIESTGHSSYSSQSEYSSVPPPPPPPVSQESYPGEEAFYNQVSQDGGPVTRRSQTGEKIDGPQKPKAGNSWKIATFALLILVLILATATTTLFLVNQSKPQVQNPSPTSVTQPVSPPATPTLVATQPGQPTAQTTPQQTPGNPTSNNYSAPQPGPGCDTNGGTWTPQGIKNINCGTTVIPAAPQTWAYLYFQLQNNTPFAASNKLTVTSNIIDSSYCVGLAEQDANTGFLVSYCGNGAWAISSISNKGIVIKSLQSNVSSTRSTVTLSLALSGNTLVFTIDAEVHQITVPALQTLKVAIAYYFTICICGNGITTNNFSYITPAN